MNPFPNLTFTAQIFKEGRQYVSFNPELRVASCGKTAEIAKENLKDAIRGFMLSAHKKGTLSDILEEATLAHGSVEVSSVHNNEKTALTDGLFSGC